MSSRGEFLQAGLAATVLPMVVTAKDSDPTGFFYKVVFDERFPSAALSVEEWKARGQAVHAMRGDITDLWFHDLDIRGRKTRYRLQA
jgi:hypothetical protein